MLTEKEFKETVMKMLRLAATRVPKDVENALEKSKEDETEEIPKTQLNVILENIETGREEGLPICQDTGVPIFFIKRGIETDLKFDIKKSLEKSVKRATDGIPLRPNIVDPLTRDNSGDNTGEKNPILHYEEKEGKGLEIDLLLKGAGSENWSQLFMMNPTSDWEDIRKKVIGALKEAGGQICPPAIIGIGIGGTSDETGLLAKKALLRPIDKDNPDSELSELERDMTEKANELGIGPMGLGGKTTVLSTQIEKAGCHTASLPVAVNFQCWAARRSRSELEKDKLRIEVPK